MHGQQTGLATELRDGLLQDLVAMSMLIEGVRRQLGTHDTTEAGVLLGHVASVLDENIDDVREMIDRLRPRAA